VPSAASVSSSTRAIRSNALRPKTLPLYREDGVAPPAAAVPGTSRMDLRAHGLLNPGPVHVNLPAAKLVEIALQRGEGVLASNGALVVRTGKHTGRAPRDKYTVRRPASQD